MALSPSGCCGAEKSRAFVFRCFQIFERKITEWWVENKKTVAVAVWRAAGILEGGGSWLRPLRLEWAE